MAKARKVLAASVIPWEDEYGMAVVLREVTASDLLVIAPKLTQYQQRIDSGQGHDQEKTAKPDQQSDAGTSEGGFSSIH